MCQIDHTESFSIPPNRAFTLVETVIAITIVGVLAAVLVPAVQQVRETGRRTACTSNLRQVGTAVWNYESAYRVFPPGATNHATWLVAILPWIEADLGISIPDSGWIDLPTAPPLYRCPSDDRVGEYDTSYAGNFGAVIQRDGSNGLFRHGPSAFVWPLRMSGYIRSRDVTDGLSQTAMAAEVLAVGFLDPTRPDRVDWNTPRELALPQQAVEFMELCAAMPVDNAGFGYSAGGPWFIDGMMATFYTHHLPPNSPRCRNGTGLALGSYSPSSLHSGGANLLSADGAVRLVAQATDHSLWQAIGSRDGAESIE